MSIQRQLEAVAKDYLLNPGGKDGGSVLGGLLEWNMGRNLTGYVEKIEPEPGTDIARVYIKSATGATLPKGNYVVRWTVPDGRREFGVVVPK